MSLRQSPKASQELSFHDWLVGEEQYTPCLHPWFSVFILAAGWVSCCPQNKTRFGNVLESPVEELWNSEPAKRVRSLLAEGRYEQAGCDAECPFLSGSYEGPKSQPAVEELIYPEFDREVGGDVYKANLQLLVDAYRSRERQVVGRPVFIDVQTTVRCNSDCIMCEQPHKERIELSSETLAGLGTLRETANWFRWQGGEVFIHKRFDAYLEAFEQGQWPQLKRYVITNGTLMSEQRLQTFSNTENPVFFLISIDGFSKSTFDRIRKGLDFDEVMAALTRLAEIQKNNGRKDLVKWNYVVMKDTLAEMKAAIDHADILGVDLNFAPIQGEYPEQNIFRYRGLMDRPFEYFEELRVYAEKKSITVSGFEGIQRRLEHLFSKDIPVMSVILSDNLGGHSEGSALP